MTKEEAESLQPGDTVKLNSILFFPDYLAETFPGSNNGDILVVDNPPTAFVHDVLCIRLCSSLQRVYHGYLELCKKSDAKCRCDIMTLMWQGCKCGYIERERNA